MDESNDDENEIIIEESENNTDIVKKNINEIQIKLNDEKYNIKINKSESNLEVNMILFKENNKDDIYEATYNLFQFYELNQVFKMYNKIDEIIEVILERINSNNYKLKENKEGNISRFILKIYLIVIKNKQTIRFVFKKNQQNNEAKENEEISFLKNEIKELRQKNIDIKNDYESKIRKLNYDICDLSEKIFILFKKEYDKQNEKIKNLFKKVTSILENSSEINNSNKNNILEKINKEIDLILKTNEKKDAEAKSKILNYMKEKETNKVLFNEKFETTALKQLIPKYDIEFNKLNSNILNNKFHFYLLYNRLLQVYKSKTKVEFNLLYRATKDGDTAEKFHELCSDTKNTLVLIETKNDCKFGGFTFRSWNCEKESLTKNDEYSFCFSLDLLKIYNKVPEQVTIECRKNCGPIFGYFQKGIGGDISNPFFIVNSPFFSAQSQVSSLDKITYTGLTMDYELNKLVCNFNVKEMEVYSLTFLKD